MEIVTKTAQCKHKHEYIDQWTIIKYPEVDTNRNSHLFPRYQKHIGETISSPNGAMKTEYLHADGWI